MLLKQMLYVIQALNGNKCNAYFVSGKIKELKPKKKKNPLRFCSSEHTGILPLLRKDATCFRSSSVVRAGTAN